MGLSLQRLPDRRGPGYHLATLLTTYGADCVLDVGGNRGQFGQMLRASGYRGRLVSFEPVDEAFRELAATAFDDPQWEVRHLALGDAPGRAEMNVAVSSSVSSFLEPTREYVSGYSGAQTARTETIEVSTLDSLRLPYQRPFLKIDTQGYDLRVLAGASELLKRAVGVQIELSVIHIYEGMPDFIEALIAMRDRGFVPSGFFPLEGVSDSRMRLMEFDGIFVRADEGSGSQGAKNGVDT
jgi:FkbM family methyltransferase